jgi:hypothetical protein
MERSMYLSFVDFDFVVAKSYTRPPGTYFHKLEPEFALAPNEKR